MEIFGPSKTSIDRLVIDGALITGSKKISSKLNDFFIEKVVKITNEIPQVSEDPMIHYRKFIDRPQNEMELNELSIDDIYKILRTMKKSDSTAISGISMQMVNMAKEAIVPILANIYNNIIRKGIYPNCWKESKIIAIPKVSNAMEAKQYRPINILEPCSKILEKYLSSTITNHMRRNNLLYENHNGSIPGRSTAKTIVSLQHKILSNKDKGNTVALVALDQSAYYDVVNHGILKNKMEHIGIRGKSLKVMSSLLSNRRQRTSINTHLSPSRYNIDAGVLQGSSASGTCALIYTLDVFNITHEEKHQNHSEYNQCTNSIEGGATIESYVDDIYGVVCGNDKNIKDRIINYLKKMKAYFNQNRLKINLDKTKIIIWNRKKANKYLQTTNICVDDINVDAVNNMKILGFVLNRALNKKDHVLRGNFSTLAQIKRRGKALMKISKFLSAKKTLS